MSEKKEITVQGVLVEVSQPYAEGHQITEAEAKALNQVRAENIGNNVRTKIKEMLESVDGDVEKIAKDARALVAEKDKDYIFTLASVGGGATRLDPLTKECRSLAKQYVTGKIKEKGMTQKEYLEKNGEDSIKELVAQISENPKIVEAAKKNLKLRESIPTDLEEI